MRAVYNPDPDDIPIAVALGWPERSAHNCIALGRPEHIAHGIAVRLPDVGPNGAAHFGAHIVAHGIALGHSNNILSDVGPHSIAHHWPYFFAHAKSICSPYGVAH